MSVYRLIPDKDLWVQLGQRSSRSKVKFMFFYFLFLPCPWTDLHQTWRKGGRRPRILAWGVHFLKGQGRRGQRSNICFFVCSPTSSRSLGRSSPNLVGSWRAAPGISSRGSFLKGQGHRGQRSNFCISAVLHPIWMKIGECLQVDPWLRFMGPIGSKVIEVKGQLHVFFCLFPYFSQALGPIFTKLGGKETGKIY